MCYVDDPDSQETLRFTQVPKTVPVGDETLLAEHAAQYLQQSAKTNNILSKK